MIQLYKYVTNKYDVNFKLMLDYQAMVESSYDSRRNRYKLVPKLCRGKQFFVNRVVKLYGICCLTK